METNIFGDSEANINLQLAEPYTSFPISPPMYLEPDKKYELALSSVTLDSNYFNINQRK